MHKMYGIVLTLITGLFFLLGGFLSKKAKNKESLNAFSVALAFVIIISLLFIDLLPEIKELLEDYPLGTKIGIIFLFALLGILLLKFLDCFIPDHHHEHHENEKNLKEHQSHVKHIGILTVFSLILHNLLEGFAIFGMALNSVKIGVLFCVSVALHNIPLGTHIFSSIDVKNNKGLITFLTLSSFIGGILFLVVGEVSNFILAIITCITLGMLFYIEIFELLPEILVNWKKKEVKIGFGIGILLLILSIFV